MKNPIIPGILIVQFLLLGIILSLGASNQAASDDAQAPKSDSCERGDFAGPPPRDMKQDRQQRLDAMAKELGVTSEVMRKAMDQTIPPIPGKHPSESERKQNHETLAKELNIDIARIEEVMHKYRPGRPMFRQRPGRGDGGDPDHGRPVEAVAKELGVTPEQFREAFKNVNPAPRGTEPTDAQRKQNRIALSKALGVDPEKLDAVMDKYRPEGPNKRPPRPVDAQ